ncbi:MAG: hypothetical protein ACYTG5_11870 [Planctomycetota bacterium]|jgi:hypothetical protein
MSESDRDGTATQAVQDLKKKILEFDMPMRQLVLGSAATFLLCLFPWYVFDTGFGDLGRRSFNGFTGLGFLAGISSLAVVLLLLLPQLHEAALGNFDRKQRMQILFGLAVATVAFGPLRELLSGGDSHIGPGADLGGAIPDEFNVGWTIWFWLACISSGVAAYGGYQALTAEQGES